MSRSKCLMIAVLLVGCSQGDMPTVEITSAAFKAENPSTVEFSVPDMFCMEGCGATVKETLAKQPGAKDVLVDFEAKTATVAIDEEKFDSDQALAALVDKQFANSSLKDIAQANSQSEKAPVQ